MSMLAYGAIGVGMLCFVISIILFFVSTRSTPKSSTEKKDNTLNYVGVFMMIMSCLLMLGGAGAYFMDSSQSQSQKPATGVDDTV